ncbi:MAG: hypothetical protein Q4C21_03835, partial [Oscillospiraceae bacterium]|nr:hypothetical protein [Oscillospiraceae bacterium]
FFSLQYESIAVSKKHPIMQKLKLLGCFAVLKRHIFVGTRKKTKQCCRIARLFDAVTAKRGLFKTVLVRPSYAYGSGFMTIAKSLRTSSRCDCLFLP